MAALGSALLHRGLGPLGVERCLLLPPGFGGLLLLAPGCLCSRRAPGTASAPRPSLPNLLLPCRRVRTRRVRTRAPTSPRSPSHLGARNQPREGPCSSRLRCPVKAGLCSATWLLERLRFTERCCQQHKPALTRAAPSLDPSVQSAKASREAPERRMSAGMKRAGPASILPACPRAR